MLAILEAIGFHETLERMCGDGGEVPISKLLEAYVHRCDSRVDPVSLGQFQDRVGNSCIPVWVAVPADRLNEYRLGRVLEMVGPRAQGMWGINRLRIAGACGRSACAGDVVSVEIERSQVRQVQPLADQQRYRVLLF